MTDQKRVADLESGALPVPSRIDLLNSAAAFFRMNPDREFELFHGIEFMHEEDLRALPVAGTPLEPIDMALGAAGVRTDGTVGNLLDLGAIDKSDVHVLVCDCHVGEPTIHGAGLSLVFQARAQHG
jgi:hypothetical protein